MNYVVDGLRLFGWAVPWIAGGVLLAQACFHLRRAEVALGGFAIGLVLEIWLANLVSQVVGIPFGFWAASALVLAAGIGAAAIRGEWRVPHLAPWSWLALGALTLLFNAIGRGLGIFDDYQNLPTVSLMAAGDVPPHFALNPSLRFGYHYFLLLFAAQLMRLGNLLPWSALDLGRALMLALPIVLAAYWTYRLTGKWLAAFLGSTVLALAGGARWLLLLLPTSVLAKISERITLIGSAASSASNLAEAMVSPWKIDGAGPIPFPFAFYSGINQPYIMLYTGIAGSGVLILLLLLLTASRWRNRGAAFVSIGLLAALALASEISFLLLGLGLVLAGIAWAAGPGRKGPRRGVLSWLSMGLAALGIAAIQGGMLTEVVRSAISPSVAAASYFDATPAFVWPPALVSAHLGRLSLADPRQLLVALLEIGPIVIVSPGLLRRWRHAVISGRWLEAGVIAGSAGLLAAMFISFKGPLFSAAPRLLSGWLLACSLYFVPLMWARAARQVEAQRITAVGLGAVTCLGGLVLLATQLAAIQAPVYSTFITQLDARMADAHWNALEPDALVFDPLVFRAPTVFGRPTLSSPTWYERSPAWEDLSAAADPSALMRAGFSYMYIDSQFWDGLGPQQQSRLTDACVIDVARLEGTRTDEDYTKDFRLLLDIRGCQ